MRLLKIIFTYILLSAIHTNIIAQNIVQINIVDSVSNSNISCAVIRFIPDDKNQFYITDENGSFSIYKSIFSEYDSITIHNMGHISKSMPCTYFSEKDKINIKLNPSSILLDGVTVNSQDRFIELGNLEEKKSKEIFVMREGDQFLLEIGNPNNIEGKIQKVKYFQSNIFNRKAPFILRVYSANKLKEELYGEVIITKPKNKKDWVEIDISSLNINFDKNGIFVGLETLPDSLYTHKKITMSSKINNSKEKVILTSIETTDKGNNGSLFIANYLMDKELLLLKCIQKYVSV